MATEERLSTPSESDVTPVKKRKRRNIFKAIGTGLAKWFREMKSELKKVVWPTPKQIVNNTLVALAFMAVFAVVIWGFDEIASAAVNLLISIGA